ncbi:MAG: xanthine dehydrogenase family protein molybdopterin-binding subunit [Gemmatimonadetes bacterium]|jgi:xanthine dehydrogenase molybdenum-binding subunit|nr:xanthine dehydrogenase family protein molybdopterin-binding subunit [Gemmatimonadota bacterium]
MARKKELKQVGQRATKVDGRAIATGQALYAADINLPGMLYGRVLHSPHAHARIRSINVDKARALDGVVDVVSAADVPDLDLFVADEVCYQGQKVAVVAAEDPDIAADALELIEVEYELLPALFDPLEAMATDAPEVRLGAPTREVMDENGLALRNVAARDELIEGDVEAGFAAADVVVEAEYRVPYFHQTYMEPNAATARLEADGRITIWTAAQGAFNIRDGVAGALKMPHGKIRVIVTQVGGGFGAKNGTFTEPHAALLTRRTGRPVKVEMKRDEEFLDGRPAPGCHVRLKTGAKKDGTLTAIEGRIVWDRGWSGGGGGAARLRGLYRIPHVKLEGLGVRTNKPAPGAYRAPGAVQTAFARESQMDLLARELGMDPMALRMKNAVRKGDGSLGGKPLEKDWMRMTLRRAAEAARWGKRRLKRNQGMGIACGEWTNGSGPSNAFITVGEDGSVSLLTGQIDITGLHTSLAQIVAEEVGVSVERVKVTLGDTDMVPYTALSAGSLATYSAGTAARQAGREARKRILSAAAEFLEVAEEKLELADGRVRVKRSKRSVGLAELAASARRTAAGPISGQWVLGSVPSHPSYSVDIATVEVDTETGQVTLLGLLAAQDVGRALNPTQVEGQMQGGAIQSIGLGLMEGYRYGDGQLLNPNLLDYPIPTILDVPDVETVLVEEPCSDGPYGAKGVGEPPIIPGAAAVANAIHDAIGVRVTELPITPERVLAALRQRAEEKA